MSKFEQATRRKFRFNTSKGPITVEDLCDLPLTATNNRPNLDDLAKDLNEQLKSSARVSFVRKTPDVDESAQLAFDIVLHIIKTKLDEQEAARKAADAREQKQKIMALIEQKKDAALSASSLEELQEMLKNL